MPQCVHSRVPLPVKLLVQQLQIVREIDFSQRRPQLHPTKTSNVRVMEAKGTDYVDLLPSEAAAWSKRKRLTRVFGVVCLSIQPALWDEFFGLDKVTRVHACCYRTRGNDCLKRS